MFQAISLFDEIHIEPITGEGHEITCDWPGLPADNTMSKALRLLQELVDVPWLAIHVKKRIPHQAGLGGGSSDAAGVLRYVARWAGSRLPHAQLEMVASAVGADVPFFLVGGRARGEGYGERLTPEPDGPTQWMVVVKPEHGVGTAEAYRQLDASDREWRPFMAEDGLYNDFERVAGCESLDWIERLTALGACDAGLSGSGSAVFGRFSSKERAESAAERIEGVSAWVVHTLTREESLWMS